MFQHHHFWIALIIAACTQTAVASTSQQRAANAAFCPAAGTTVMTDTGDTYTYLGPAENDPEMCVRAHNGDPVNLLFNLAAPINRSAPEGSADAQRVMLRRLFPLRAGAKTEGHFTVSVQNRTVSSQRTLEVLREERITIPAGTFDTWVIQSSVNSRSDRRLNNGVFHMVTLTWFDKATGTALRMRVLTHDTGLSSSPPDWEAVRVTQPR